MVTRKQDKQFQKMHDQLLQVYHVKEDMRSEIVLLPAMFEKFSTTIETQYETRKELIPILADGLSPDSSFLEVYLQELNVFFDKSLSYLSKNVAVHDEVKRTMSAMIKASRRLGMEDFTIQDSTLLLEKLSKRINRIEKRIAKSKVGLSTIKKEFTTLQIRYQYLNN